MVQNEVIDFVLVSLLLTLNVPLFFFSVYVVNFEQVNAWRLSEDSLKHSKMLQKNFGETLDPLHVLSCKNVS